MGGGGLLCGGTVRREMSSGTPDTPRTILTADFATADFASPNESEYIFSGQSQSEPDSENSRLFVDEHVTADELVVSNTIYHIIPVSLKSYIKANRIKRNEVTPEFLCKWINYDGNADKIADEINSLLSASTVSQKSINIWTRSGVGQKLLKLVSDTPGCKKYLQTIINDANQSTEENDDRTEENDDRFYDTLGAIITSIIVDTIDDIERSHASTKKFSQGQLQQLFKYCNVIMNNKDERETRIINSHNIEDPDPNELISLLWWMRCDSYLC